MARPYDFLVRGSQDNALLTVNISAAANRRHVLTGFEAHYSVDTISGKLIQIKDWEGTLVWEGYVHKGQLVRSLGDGEQFRFATGKGFSIELAASGTAGQIGKLNVFGYTE